MSDRVLDLQRSAGNAAVTRLIVQRKETVKAAQKVAHDAPATVNNYGALIVGFEDQIEHWKKPGPIATGAFTPDMLNRRHRGMLQATHDALVQMHTAPQDALAAWEPLASQLHGEVAKAAKAGLDKEAIDLTYEHLEYASDKLFYPAAYWAAKNEKKAEGHLESPDMVAMEGKAKQAEKAVIDAKKVFEDSAKMAAGLVDAKQLPVEVGGIIDLVEMNGTMAEKLALAHKRGWAVTMADLTAKLTAVSGSLLNQASTIGLKYCEHMGTKLLREGGEAAAKKAADLAKTAERFKELGKKAAKIGEAAAMIAIAVDVYNIVDALAQGDYGAARDAAVDALTDAAPLAFGADIAGPLAVGIVVVKAQIEVIHLAAEFIRWCKDETVRQAAMSFVDDCTKLAKGAAFDLVADAEIALDPSKASVHAIAQRQIVGEAQRVAAGLRTLGSHVSATEKNAIGAYPDVVRSLGKEAIDAMAMPFDEPLLAVEQVGAVFKGANRMARHVRYTYTN